ncbi:unnamed protein product [Euphydryas editha]|uniref:Uncharacterized protein n=1 Tax=Euphydryas editha TaxID=104508 RepID=A0AAU9TPM9_EUPED|nr:unnamed protein product [Euphydryas editha]
MQCHKTILTMCFVMATVLPGSFGDLMKWNDTTYLEIPPLFHLDEWALCQRPKDVYCMVDAALISPKPSPLFDFLKEYSSNTQKHYNRTLVHRGVCISKCGAEGPETWRGAAERCLNNNLAQYGLEV